MSGGHFNYLQNQLSNMAEQVDELIQDNEEEGFDEWGGKLGTFFDNDIVDKFKKTSHYLKQTAEMVQRVDWLISGDDGEESFKERWREEVRKDYSYEKHENSIGVDNLQLLECANELLLAATNYADAKRETT